MATRTKAEAGVKPPRVRDEQPAREPPRVVAVPPAAPALAAERASRTSTSSVRSPHSVTCPSKCTPGRSARSATGRPKSSMQIEVLPTWELDSHEVLVLVMAAGVNYNGVWAGLGTADLAPSTCTSTPITSPARTPSGIVWAVGSKVKRWKVGDEVVIHCNQDDGDDEECNGGDPMFSPSQRIWGYETPDGSFAQFCRVQDRQLMERPKHLTWEEAPATR